MMGIVEAPSAWQDYWQGYWLGAVLAGSVCVVALTLFFVWSLAAAVVVTAIMFLTLVAMLAILDLAPALGLTDAVKLRDHINVFIALHATFAVFGALLTGDSQCDEKVIHNYDEHYNMQFISTKMLQAKYSRRLECNLLPPLVNMNTAALIVQVHVTLCVLARGAPDGYMHGHMHDVLCYLAVLGFSAVMVFDSQNVTGRADRTHVHLMGVALVVVSMGVMHGLALVGAYMIHLFSRVYLGFVGLYAVSMLVFMILFVAEQPFAVQSEYAVLVLFFTLSACNLFMLARVVELEPRALAEHKQALNRNRLEYVDNFASVVLLVCVMGLISMIFLLEYVSM